jgi:hypothetical protein
VTSMSVSLVLRLMVALRMKSASFSPKRGPFNRLMQPSLLRDGALGAELPPMVTEIRPLFNRHVFFTRTGGQPGSSLGQAPLENAVL